MTSDEIKRQRHREAAKRYREKYPDRVKEQQERWHAANPGRRKEITEKYNAKDPEKKRVRVRNRRARIRSAEGTHTAEDIVDILRLQRGKCAHPWCRKAIKRNYHVDHIKALARGGSNARTNIQLLCAPCNQKKHSKDAIEFSRSFGLLL
jgi:5-methylcytosine-specific restriction endonuclease McrA